MSGTFEVQIEALTGIAIDGTDSEVTTTDINNFIKAGTRDVITNVSKYKPHDLHMFASTQDGSITSAGFDVYSTVLVNAWRADGVVEENLNQCTQINAALKHRAADVDSLHYRGKANPCYYWENTKVFILPEPSGPTVDKAQISYIDYSPHNYAYDDASVNLSENYYPLIAIYAAIKQLEAYMAFYVVTEEDVELATGLQANIATLKQQFQNAFVKVQPPQGQPNR